MPFGVNVLAGIPFATVGAGQPLSPMTFNMYGDESNPGPYPFPDNAPIEGAPPGCPPANCNGDRHVLVVDTVNCLVYETWKSFKNAGAGWTAANGAVFNLTSAALRPLGWTSADAAGLSIFAGLVRYDETVLGGSINHAIRMTFPTTRHAYVLPATHYASSNKNQYAPAMGARLRLKASYACGGLTSAEARVVCAALKKYGAIVADNGSPWYISGEANAAWNAANVNAIKAIPTSAFEFVYTGAPCLTADCSVARVPPTPARVSAIADLSQLRAAHNTYHRMDAAWLSRTATFYDRMPGRMLVGGSLAQWQNHTGTDGTSIEADPGLDANYAPRLNVSGSLLAAPSHPLVTDDYYGRARPGGGLADVGAIAVSGVPSSPAPRAFPPAYSTANTPACAGTPHTAGTPWIVDPLLGSDASCTGSGAAPLKTLGTALALAAPGDTIALRAGTHAGPVTIGTPGLLITGPGLPGATTTGGTPAQISCAFLDASVGDCVTVAPTATGVTFQNISIRGGYRYALAVTGNAFAAWGGRIHGSGQANVAVMNGAVGASFKHVALANGGQMMAR